MRTYVKIEGKDIDKIIQRLARIAVDSPEICVWDSNITLSGWLPSDAVNTGSLPSSNQIDSSLAAYFGMDPKSFEKDCDNIIAKSGGELGEYNMYFEWKTRPSSEQLKELENKIDTIVKSFGNKYTITNK